VIFTAAAAAAKIVEHINCAVNSCRTRIKRRRPQVNDKLQRLRWYGPI